MCNTPVIGAVVTVYNPSEPLADTVRALKDQVDVVVMVDDGSRAECHQLVEALVEGNVQLVRQPRNAGIAAALNAGVTELRRSCGPDLVLTLDQDSILPAQFVERAVATYNKAVQAGLAVGLVSAASYSGCPIPVSRVEGAFVHAFDPMQSGCLIPVGTFDAVGLFDESLVIDGVDSDFTARVMSAGLLVLVGDGCDVVHALGHRENATVFGRPVRVLGKPLQYNYHAPFRVYYITRNGLVLTGRYLRRQPLWVLRRGWKESQAHAMRLVLGRDRWRTLTAMLRGAWDAVRGKRGRASGF